MWKTIAVGLMVALVAMGLQSCGEKSPLALGEEWEIYAVADPQDWQVVGPMITDALEKKLITPQVETEFKVIHVDPKDFKNYLRMRNLLLISSLEPGTKMDLILRKSLKSEIYDKIVKNEEYFFMSKDQWAADQFIIILAAPGRKALKASIESYPDYIYQIFNSHRNEKLRMTLFWRTRGRLEKRLKKAYGWTMKIPPYYEVAEEDSVNHLVHLKTPEPERHIFVHWIDHPNRKKVNEQWLRDQINKMSTGLYDSRVIDGYYYSTKRRFQNRPALVMIGLWQSNKNESGGPFQAMAFYDRNLDRIYVMMYAVYAPNHRKESYSRELNMVVNTFMTAAEEKRPS